MGFTLAQLDEVLVPYGRKTLDNARKTYDEFFGDGDNEKREKFAWHTLKRELEQGTQSLELKLNTVNRSSRSKTV